MLTDFAVRGSWFLLSH